MRFAWDKETRTFAGGAALALACGIVLGGAMRPDLGGDGRPAGPQQIAGVAGLRSTGPFDPGLSEAAYATGGQVPDYVMGTDWKTAMAGPSERAAVARPRREAIRAEPADAVDAEARDEAASDWAQPVTRAAYEDPPAPRGRYPSLGGAAPAPEPEPDDEAEAVTG